VPIIVPLGLSSLTVLSLSSVSKGSSWKSQIFSDPEPSSYSCVSKILSKLRVAYARVSSHDQKNDLAADEKRDYYGILR
jgi:hypothetical protein